MLRTLFVFGILIPGIFAALSNRFASLLLYLWFALFRPQEFTWVDFSSLRLSLVLGILLVLPSLLTGILPNVSHPLSIGAILFLLASALAQLGAVNQVVGMYWLDFLVRLILVCLLAVTLTDTRHRFVLVVSVIAASFGFHTAKAGVYSIMRGGARFADGLAGAFSDNNGYAVGMVMILWFLVAAAQNSEHKWIRRGFFAAVPLTAFATVSTFSRGGLIALSLSTLIFVLLQRRRALPALGLALIVTIVPFIPLPDGYTERMETITTYEEVGDDSALSRLHFWQVAVAMAADNPFGVGLFNFESVYDRYDFLDGRFGRRRSVHSSFFQVIAETGFFGAAVYFAMLGYAFVVVLRVRKRSRTPALESGAARFLLTSANALGASLAGFIGGGAFIALALNDLTWLIFALLASLDRLSAAMVESQVVERPADSSAPVLRPELTLSGYVPPSKRIGAVGR